MKDSKSIMKQWYSGKELKVSIVREIKFEQILKDKISGTIKKIKYELEDMISGFCTYNTAVYKLIARRQYTGLKDKNGVEIYEGDILFEEEESGGAQRKLRRHSIVVFENNGWKRDSYNGSLNVFPQINCRSMEVIGNIYENPELLEAK